MGPKKKTFCDESLNLFITFLIKKLDTLLLGKESKKTAGKISEQTKLSQQTLQKLFQKAEKDNFFR